MQIKSLFHCVKLVEEANKVFLSQIAASGKYLFFEHKFNAAWSEERHPLYVNVSTSM